MSSSSPERDRERENCVFYQRIGACRHGPKCSRVHKPPKTSKTVMIRNLFRYVQPTSSKIVSTSPDNISTFESFYEEVFTEIEEAYGTINQMHVCENMGEHLVGNVYVKFQSRQTADRAVKMLNNRYFAGLPIFAELSPVNDFRDAVCRQHDLGECSRGGFCNFLHIKHVSDELEDKLKANRGDTDSEGSCSSMDEDNSDYSLSDDCMSPCSSASCSSMSFTDGFSSEEESEDSEGLEVEKDEEIDEEDDDSPVPRAFRIKPLKVASVESSDNEDEENDTVKEYLQTGRRIRWKLFQKKMTSEEQWDDAKEQQYVFQLLDLT